METDGALVPCLRVLMPRFEVSVAGVLHNGLAALRGVLAKESRQLFEVVNTSQQVSRRLD
jgi:hypothetical protein